MAAGATIGALRVVLGADTAAFESSMGRARSSLSSFGRSMSGFATGVTAAFAVAAVAVAAFAHGIHKALEEADKLFKLSQQVNITVESLSVLRHVSELAGVSMEGLTTGLTRLNRAMAEATSDSRSAVARTFDALGISLRNASGELRSTQEVLEAVAVKMAGFADNAQKTAIAIALFGRQGAAMIPFLNQLGREGFGAAADEAARFGRIVSGETAAAAEKFNDTLRKIGQVVQGVFDKLAEKLLPTLQQVADAFLRWQQESKVLELSLATIDVVIKALAISLTAVTAASEGVIEVFKRLFAAFKATFVDRDPGEAVRILGQIFPDVAARARELADAIKGIAAGVQDLALGIGAVQSGTGRLPQTLAPVIASAQSMADALRKWRDEQRALMDDIVSAPTEILVNKLRAIKQALEQNIITEREWGRLNRQILRENQQHWFDLGTATASALTSIFGKNKVAQIASIIILTATAIMRALATLPPPFSWAQASLAAAVGAAQLAAVKSTTMSGSGKTPSVSGGGGGGDGGAEPAAMTPSQGFTIDLKGDTFSRESVRQLIERLNLAVKDGHVLLATNIA